MQNDNERQVNQEAYRRLRETIKQTYAADRYVAISAGKIVADAASFPELEAALKALGSDSRETLVVQAGVDYSDYVVILFRCLGPPGIKSRVSRCEELSDRSSCSKMGQAY
jgi:hypothetical protein